jgi:hypothetical protein
MLWVNAPAATINTIDVFQDTFVASHLSFNRNGNYDTYGYLPATINFDPNYASFTVNCKNKW